MADSIREVAYFSSAQQDETTRQILASISTTRALPRADSYSPDNPRVVTRHLRSLPAPHAHQAICPSTSSLSNHSLTTTCYPSLQRLPHQRTG
ncbi:integrin beta-4 precursor [Corchorus olitorius]|uniref:Integrin beta-4 n=1 Tax=Corchorus olitorius TaxID=93759 RepID=A0A1R3HL62_9ROSI|nr:integrin beta-4 precursor [Corchorus olitorius]